LPNLVLQKIVKIFERVEKFLFKIKIFNLKNVSLHQGSIPREIET